MRRGSTLTIWLAALIALTGAGLATAAGERPVEVRVGQLEFSANAVFSPKAGSRTKPAPVKIELGGEIGMADGSHPPALKEVIVEADRNGTVNAKGIPTCSAGELQSRDTKAAEAACRPAIIGTGRTTVEVAFPEQRPVMVNSKLLLVNGGVRGGTTTWYVHAYFNAPITGAIVTTVKIEKHRNGRYGTRSVASVPKIAGGAGSVRSFELTIVKNVEGAGGRTYHPITGRCTDGKVQFHSEAVFADGTEAAAEIVRTCTPKP